MKFDIAIATDSNYIVPTTVLLKSLFQNNRDIDFTVNILYLVESLDLKDLTWLESYIVSNGQKVRKLPVTSEDLGRVPDCRHTKSAIIVAGFNACKYRDCAIFGLRYYRKWFNQRIINDSFG